MCGIAGGIRLDNKSWDTKKILSYISHRGPDSQGSFEEGNLFLGHTRLSIQDLSENGNQPMFSDDLRYVIIFNGEIYNHMEIRKELVGEFTFKSTGDTETILYAYIKYGPEFLNKLNGIFSLAIYDRLNQDLFLARDQMGVKPMYIYQAADLFLFSSEIKTFTSFDINRDISPEALVNYLTFLWSPGKITPFKHVTKLLPGHYLKFSINNFQEAKPVQYFQLQFNGKYSQLSEAELIDILDQKLVKAVERQMLSDVPVGFFLSGGLDSSLLVAIAKKKYPNINFPCFTIDIDTSSEGSENFSNDIFYAKKVAQYLKVELNIVKAGIDILEDFDKMVWCLDEPQADAAPLNVLNIASLARSKGIKVLLGGAGGDDLFSGYRRHQALQYEKYFTYVPLILRKICKYFIQYLPARNSFSRKLRKLTIDLDKTTEERLAGYFTWLPSGIVYSLFTKQWQQKLEGYTPLAYLENLCDEIPEEKDLLNKMLYWEMRTFLVDHNLNYTDKMAMAVGVEARVPYLDLELVEFSMLIPPALKMKGKETKYLLKKVAERYLPTDVIYRPKTGFGAPVRKWVINDLDPMIKKYLSVDQIKRRGIFNPDKIWELIDKNKNGYIDASYSILAILAIESWIQQFVDKRN